MRGKATRLLCMVCGRVHSMKNHEATSSLTMKLPDLQHYTTNLSLKASNCLFPCISNGSGCVKIRLPRLSSLATRAESGHQQLEPKDVDKKSLSTEIPPQSFPLSNEETTCASSNDGISKSRSNLDEPLGSTTKCSRCFAACRKDALGNKKIYETTQKCQISWHSGR